MSLSPLYMEQNGMVIEIYHAPSRQTVTFRAWLTAFDDGYSQSWNKEKVFGRMDPHQVYENTERVIGLAWKVLAEDIETSKINMQKVSLLAQMQYPVYDMPRKSSFNTSTSIQGSPVFRLKFLNWIHR